MNKRISASVFIFCMISALVINVYAQNKAITIKGSDTMVILVQRWTELFHNKNSKVDFQVTGGGSGTGIAALLNGTTDICSSSRPIKSEEVQKLKDKFKTKCVEVRVARDGVALYVHKKNKVNKLTLEQIRNIFMGKITNLKELGVADKKITLYSRENNSGTDEFFKEHILNKVNLQKINADDVLVSNIRHLEALQKTQESLNRVLENIGNPVTSDFLAMDIKQALYYLGLITGQVTTDDLLETIFSKFCIGK